MRGVIRGAICAFVILFVAINTFAAENRRSTGWVKVDGERALYVDFERPAPGKPIIVLVNGLTYRTGIWDGFVDALRGDGVGILRFDPMGMGRTLLRYAPATSPFDYKEQVRDMRRLFQKMNLRQPLHFVGLSYGGALATVYATEWPEHVASLISMAPFVGPLEKMDQWIKLQIRTTRIMFPTNPASDDELYDFFLRTTIYQTYPMAEPIVLENPFKLEATFRLVQGARRYEANQVVDRLPRGKFHLLIAREDQYITNRVHNDHWDSVPVPVRASRVYIEHSEHKIPEAVPRFSAQLVRRIVAGDPIFSRGRTLVADPKTGTVNDGRQVIIRGLPRE